MQHSAADRDRSPLRQTAFCVAGPLKGSAFWPHSLCV